MAVHASSGGRLPVANNPFTPRAAHDKSTHAVQALHRPNRKGPSAKRPEVSASPASAPLRLALPLQPPPV